MAWENLRNKLEHSEQRGMFPVNYYISPQDPKYVWVRGNGTYAWRSSDNGNTFEAMTPPGIMSWVTFHPSVAKVVMARTGNNLYLTTNFGQTWSMVARDVVDAD